MTQAIRYLPEAEADELIFLQKIFDGLTESQAQFYASLYRARRRDPMLILVVRSLDSPVSPEFNASSHGR
jgi:hypothetical protein